MNDPKRPVQEPARSSESAAAGDGVRRSPLRLALRTLVFAVSFGFVWAVYEAAFVYLTKFHQHVLHHPSSGIHLFLSGLAYYGFYGLLLGLVLAPAVALAGRLGRRPQVPALLVALVIGGGAAVGGIRTIRKEIFWGLTRDDPRLVTANVIVAILGLVLIFVSYRLAAPVARRLGRRLSAVGRNRRRFALGLAVVPVVLVVAGTLVGLAKGYQVGAGRPPQMPKSVPGRGSDGVVRPNVVLITLETTRADHLNSYGYTERTTSPNIDRLIERGTAYRHAFATSSWTRPSMASLFTSLYPSQHGLTTRAGTLGDGVLTMAELFAEHGYTTASIYTNTNAGSRSYAFDFAYNVTNDHRGRVVPLQSSPFMVHWLNVFLARGLRLSFLSPRFISHYRDADVVNVAVRQWLEADLPEPVFLHVHYLDPHDPYYRHPYAPIQFNPRTERGRERLLEVYDGEIHFVDRAVGEMLEMLEEGGVLDDAIVVLTSDHGEEFLDHGGWGHGDQLHRESIEVPLVFVAPGVPAGRWVDEPVSFVDIAPTIAELAGLGPVEAFEGRTLLARAPEGSAAGEVVGSSPPADASLGEETVDEDATAHAAAPAAGESAPERSRVLAQLTVLDVEHDSWISGDWKLIRIRGHEGESDYQLFNRRTDPDETDDVSRDEPDVLRNLIDELNGALLELRSRTVPSKTEELTREELRQLRALGYMN